MEVGKLLPRHDETANGREFEKEPSCAVLQPETLHGLLLEFEFSMEDRDLVTRSLIMVNLKARICWCCPASAAREPVLA